MALAFEKVVTPSARTADPPETGRFPAGLNIDVVFTSVETTLAALRKAGIPAHKVDARITLVVPQVGPSPLPLASPPVLLHWNEWRFRTIAEGSPVETSFRLYLCKDNSKPLSPFCARTRSLFWAAGIVGGRPQKSD